MLVSRILKQVQNIILCIVYFLTTSTYCIYLIPPPLTTPNRAKHALVRQPSSQISWRTAFYISDGPEKILCLPFLPTGSSIRTCKIYCASKKYWNKLGYCFLRLRFMPWKPHISSYSGLFGICATLKWLQGKHLSSFSAKTLLNAINSCLKTRWATSNPWEYLTQGGLSFHKMNLAKPNV